MTPAIIFAVLALVVICFQVVLLLGAPWGRLTWGGKYPGRLPRFMRIVAGVSALLLAGFALTVLVRAGVLVPSLLPASRVAIWIVVGYSVVGIVANATTKSRWERILWLPTTVGMLVCSLIVALG